MYGHIDRVKANLHKIYYQLFSLNNKKQQLHSLEGGISKQIPRGFCLWIQCLSVNCISISIVWTILDLKGRDKSIKLQHRQEQEALTVFTLLKSRTHEKL